MGRLAGALLHFGVSRRRCSSTMRALILGRDTETRRARPRWVQRRLRRVIAARPLHDGDDGISRVDPDQ
jgi:hypothetical protein